MGDIEEARSDKEGFSDDEVARLIVEQANDDKNEATRK